MDLPPRQLLILRQALWLDYTIPQINNLFVGLPEDADIAALRTLGLLEPHPAFAAPQRVLSCFKEAYRVTERGIALMQSEIDEVLHQFRTLPEKEFARLQRERCQL